MSNRLAVLTVILLLSRHVVSAQWTDVSATGPDGARSIALSADGTVYVGLGGALYNSRGVVKSIDGGMTWMSSGLATEPIEGLTIAPNGYLFAASYYPPNIFRSTDGGTSWTPLDPPNLATPWEAVSHPSGAVLVAADNGAHRSTDWGNTWVQANTGLSDSLLRDAFVSSTGLLFVRTYNGKLFRSTDVGLTWSDATPSGTSVATIGEGASAHLIVSTSIPNSLLFVSTDGGVSWGDADSSLFGTFIRHIAGNVSGTLVAAGGSFYSSSGSDWSLAAYPPYGIERLLIRQDGTIFAACHAGVAVSDDAGFTWNISRSMHGAYILSMTSTSDGSVYAMTNVKAIFRTTDQGQSWRVLPYDVRLHSPQTLSSDDSDRILVGSGSSGVLRSTDSGLSWDTLTTLGSGGMYLSIAHGAPGVIVVSATDGVYRTVDDGLSWSKTSDVDSYSSIFTSDGSFLLADINVWQVHRSTDSGATWTSFNVGAGYTGIRAVAEVAPRVILAGRNDGSLYRSTDDGQTWDRWDSTGVPSSTVTSIFPASDDAILASYPSYGTFRSLDGGRTWSAWETGITEPSQVWCFTLDAAGYVYAGSDGVARTANPVLSVIEAMSQPAEWQLEQNVPNPFNPTTRIGFRTVDTGPVRLVVFDMLGRQREVLFDGVLRSGEYRSVIVEGANWTSGVYFARLEGIRRSETRKMLLIR